MIDLRWKMRFFHDFVIEVQDLGMKESSLDSADFISIGISIELVSISLSSMTVNWILDA